MTRRQRLEMVIRGELNEELIEDCKRELEKLDAKLGEVKAKERPTYEENKDYEGRILEVLSEETEPVQIDRLAELVQCTFARQRLTAICTNLVRRGEIGVVDVKTKKGKRKGYYLIVSTKN